MNEPPRSEYVARLLATLLGAEHGCEYDEVSVSYTHLKLDKKVKSVNSEWKLKEIHRLQDTEEIIGKTYTCPKSLISFRTARKHCPSQNAF